MSLRRSAPSGGWVLLATIVGSSMSMIDATAVNVALPAVGRDLDAGAAALQWVVESYSVTLASLILLGGALGDRYGRRRIFGLGIAVFTLSSIACGAAPSIGWLVAARALQGVGGALATPGSLALIAAAFEGEERGRAIGTWSAFSAATSALGPVLGGFVVQTLSWRAVFYLNVPLALVVGFALARGVAESRDPRAPRRLDVAGAAIATAGLGALVAGLLGCEGALSTPHGPEVATAACGLALLTVFVVVERRERAPMIDLSLFRSRAFTLGNVYTFLLYGALGGSLYFVPFDAIVVQGYAPSAAGAVLLPTIGLVFAGSRFSGGLVARIGARWPLLAGALTAAAGFVLFGSVGVGRPYVLSFLPASLVLGCALAVLVAPLTTMVLGAAGASRAGIASAVNNAVSRAAGLVAIAALGIVLAASFDRAYAHPAAPTAPPLSPAALERSFRDRAGLLAGHVPSSITDERTRDAVRARLREAFGDGFRDVMRLSAILCLLAAAVAAGLPGAPRASADEGVRRPPAG